jgi:UDP-N-acetylmuramoyl-L-alanyl-D-glutamate--2,6-diaminopimelate ligase
VRLDLLLGDVDVLDQRGDLAAVEVSSVTHDSRLAAPGALFCCVRGRTVDGHDLAPSAVAAGAVALLCERPLDLGVAEVRVASTRAAMGPVAAAFWGHPSRSLRVAGVTGTNGKTTVTHLLRSVFEAHGWPSAVIGTLGGARTTPEATELQALLAGFVDEGRRAVAMEVSSHALDQHRVDATRFAVAGFTNLSNDHLDYHGDMEPYFAAKAGLFEPDLTEVGVVGADDPWGARLAEKAAVPVRTYSMADAEDLSLSASGSSFRWRGQPVRLRLGGRFNVSNALCAATMAEALDVPPDVVAAGLSALPSVPGRFERVDEGQDCAVVVDYAHPPDGLAAVIAAAREAAPGGRVIVVFGCGGDRDRGKRPMMGAVASAQADLAVLTDDNPRSEDPAAIVAEVLAGVADRSRLVVERDRAAAIALAVGEAQPGDIVVVAGKGHETAQVFGDRSLPFDDREVARDALRGRR